MKVLIINTNELSGGAAKAANRLHKGLRDSGVESFMFVQKKQTNDKYVIGATPSLFFRGINFLRNMLDALPKKMYRNREKVPWSVGWLPNPLLFYYINKIKPDIINLHWINGGFISIKQIHKLSKLNIPIVWTLHDSWAFTGGCHIPHHQEKCSSGKCPLLNSNKEYDLSDWIWEKKEKFLKPAKLTIVTPSNWMKKCAEESALFKNKQVYRISNGIDIKEFKSISKTEAREKLNLSQDKKYILFGAMSATTDKNKGFDLLLKSLDKLNSYENVELLIFGDDKEVEVKTKIPIRRFGRIGDTRILNLLYSASDITVVPSRSENLPNVAIESFLSGTPVVGFNVGGIPDIIDHTENGYLAVSFDTSDLANGIQWCLEDDEKNKKLSISAREKAVRKFSLERQVGEYINLYKTFI